MCNITKFDEKTSDNLQYFKELSKNYSLIRLNGKKPIEKGWTTWCEKKENRPFDDIGVQSGNNIGIPCGPGNDLLVVDIDDMDIFNKSMKESGWEIPPNSMTIETGGGGRHVYFKYPRFPKGKRFGNKALKQYGFDIKGYGGYVVAPGSTHPDTCKKYNVLMNGEIHDPPQWLLELYDNDEDEENDDSEELPKSSDMFDVSDVDSIVISEKKKKLIKDGKPEGERSEPLMGVVDALVAAGLSDNHIFQIFDNYAIGEKYREKGASKQKWLQCHIRKARKFVNAPKQEKTPGYSFPKSTDFPLDIFPDKYKHAIAEISEAIGTPVEIPSLALISLIGACIGRTRCINLKASWTEYPNLYLGIIGPSGIGKTPGTNAIFKHVTSIEKQWYADYKKDMTNSESSSILKQLLIDDSTPEALSSALLDNPRGILWNRDELAGLFLDLDKYSNKEGATKTRLMSAYDSGPWKVNRADKEKNKYIANATLSIFGTIQPSALTEIFKKRDIETGFVPRFLFAFVMQDSPSLWTEKEISQETNNELNNLVNTVLDFDFSENGQPETVTLEPDAKKTFVTWHDSIILESWYVVDDDNFRMTLARKLHAQCLRLALIIHIMACVAEKKTELTPISINTIKKAIRLSEYFKEQKIYVLRIIAESARSLGAIEKRVVEAIIQLENEITNSMIPTSRVTELVNRDLDEKFHIDSRAVGKIAKLLGLSTKHMPDGNSRGIVITEEDLERLKNI